MHIMHMQVFTHVLINTHVPYVVPTHLHKNKHADIQCAMHTVSYELLVFNPVWQN